MADNPHENAPFNPMLFWTDLTLRAADMAMASAQNLGDGMDRLARAGAMQPELFYSPLRTEPPSGSAPAEVEPAPEAGPPADPFALWQALGMEMVNRGWQQWLSSMGGLWSFGAQRALLLPSSTANPWATLAAPERGSTARSGTRRHAAGESPAAGLLEHAAAGQEKRAGDRARRPRAKPSARR